MEIVLFHCQDIILVSATLLIYFFKGRQQLDRFSVLITFHYIALLSNVPLEASS